MTEKAKMKALVEVTTKEAIAAAFICSSKCLFYPYFHLYMLYTGSNITTVNNSNTYYITRILMRRYYKNASCRDHLPATSSRIFVLTNKSISLPHFIESYSVAEPFLSI